MRVILLSPEGQRVGSYRTHIEAARRGKELWPDQVAGRADEDPGCFQLETKITKRDLTPRKL